MRTVECRHCIFFHLSKFPFLNFIFFYLSNLTNWTWNISQFHYWEILIYRFSSYFIECSFRILRFPIRIPRYLDIVSLTLPTILHNMPHSTDIQFGPWIAGIKNNSLKLFLIDQKKKKKTFTEIRFSTDFTDIDSLLYW